jgi:hypothetical protein
MLSRMQKQSTIASLLDRLDIPASFVSLARRWALWQDIKAISMGARIERPCARRELLIFRLLRQTVAAQ